jgi:hypothetical protein
VPLLSILDAFSLIEDGILKAEARWLLVLNVVANTRDVAIPIKVNIVFVDVVNLVICDVV